MFIPNDAFLYLLAKEIIRERLSEAEAYCMVYMCRRKNPGWFTRAAYWLLAQLGRLMLTWGARLQHHSFTTREMPTAIEDACESVMARN